MAGLLLDVLLKPALVVAVAAVIAGLLRRRTASARHAVWAGAVIGVLALPLLEAVLPQLSLTSVMSLPNPRTGARDLRSAVSVIVEAERFGTMESVLSDAPVAGDKKSSALLVAFAWMMVTIWIAGALTLSVRRFRAGVAVRGLMDSPVRSRWLEGLAADIAGELGLRRSVRLVLTSRIEAPGTVGFFEPVVLLPLQARDWSSESARAVLTHELAHVARADYLINLLGDFAAILYWCNPLVLLAVRRMRTESERACDDAAIECGTDPDRLADMLLALARGRSGRDVLPGAVTALARPRELESRLLALLDGSMPRGRVRGGVALALALISALAAMPVAALTLDGASESLQGPRAPEPDTVRDSVRGPMSERLYPMQPATPANLVPVVLSGPDSLLTARLLDAARMAPRHAIDLVPERAAWALAQQRNGRLIDPLIEALNAADWRVITYAAWALGIARSRRAVPALLPLMEHAVWRVRAMTAFALREIADPGALAIMDRALADPAWQVRSQAVHYFAALGGPGLSDRIRPRLTDRHIAVRLAAAQALAIH